jgi:hypothetical protein
MDYVELHLSVWKDRLYRFGKAGQTIYRCDRGTRYVPDSAILEIRQNAQPEVCSFLPPNLKVKNFI